MNEIASRYANGLYSLALEEQKVNEWQSEVKIINQLLIENKEFLDVLSSSFLDLKDKEKMLDETFVSVSKEIVNLMKLVIKNHRQRYLLDILKAFNSLCNAYRGVKEGLIYSTSRLDTKTLEKIRIEISKVEGIDVELYNIIDPTLIGGVKVVIDGHIYDGSIKSRLTKLKESLLK